MIVAKTIVVKRHNEVTVPGNFVGGRIDREFRVVVDGYAPITMRNLTDMQVFRCYAQRLLIRIVVRGMTMPIRIGCPDLSHVDASVMTGVLL